MEARTQALGVALLTCLGLAACAPSTKVSVSANAGAAYSHVYVTASALWFNTSASAGPDDTTWLKYPLAAPVTIDLASNTTDPIVQLACNLKLNPGTYSQVRLIPVDAADQLTKSASSAGALYNSEADFVDSAGLSQRVPLELLNPAKGIGLTGSLKIQHGTIPDNASAASTTFSLGLAFDASRDLVLLNDGSGTRVLFNPHGSAYDLSVAGAIAGTVEVAALANVSTDNGRTDVQVTAETLSADGSRHVPVLSAPVRSDGSFTLYPLATDATTPASYDLVIHSAGIATVIIRAVPVATGSATATTTTNIGSIAPRDSTSYAVNLKPGNDAMLPAGAVARFHQTLPGTAEVPYSIAQASVEPRTRALNADLRLANETVDLGTFVSTGATIALSAQTPAEGAGVYRVAGASPLYADGPLTTTVAASGGSSKTVATVAVPSLSVASGSTAATITATVNRALFDALDRGELLLTRDGSIVDSLTIDTALQHTGGAALTFANLPGGAASATFPSGLYYLTVRAWNSADPDKTLRRFAYLTPLDLRSESTAQIAITVN